VKCPKCQFRPKKGEKFCGLCGTQLILVCPSCGFENAPDYKFCGESRPLPWMAKMTLVKGRGAKPEQALQRAEVRPREEEKPAPQKPTPPPDIAGEPTAAETEEKGEALEKKAEAEGIDEKARAVETEEVMEPEDISEGEEVLPTVRGLEQVRPGGHRPSGLDPDGHLLRRCSEPFREAFYGVSIAEKPRRCGRAAIGHEAL